MTKFYLATFIFCCAVEAKAQWSTIGVDIVPGSTSSKLGIGLPTNTSPSELLHVYSTSQYPRISVQSAASNGAPGFDIRDASGTPRYTWHYDIGNGFMGFFQYGVGNRMVINNNGDVGIGIPGPSAKLHVFHTGTAAWQNAVNVTSNNPQDHWPLVISTNNKSNWSGFVGLSDDINLYLRKNDGTISSVISSNGPSFLNGGNVSIGTSTTAGKLSVLTEADKPAIKLIGGSGITSSSLSSKWNLPTTNSTSAYLPVITTAWDAAGGLGIIEGAGVSSPTVWMYAAQGRNAFTIARKSDDPNGANLTNIDNYLYPLFQVRENGYVGIGTTSPVSTLSIKGDFGINIEPYSGGPANFYVTSNSSNNIVGVNARTKYGAWEIPDSSKPSSFVDFSTYNVNNPYYGGIAFYTRSSGASGIGTEKMVLLNNGNVGIGNINPDAKLAVTGQVHAQEVKVTVTAPGPDYVFEKDYKLTSLEDIKNYIDQNKHLPEVPSAKEMEKNGVQLGEMNMLLLKKIEELTLYVIEQNKKMEILTEKVRTLEAKK